MKIIRSVFAASILLLSLVTGLGNSVLYASEYEFNCNFRWNNIDHFLRLSQNGDTLVCLTEMENSAQLSIQSLSEKNSTSRNVSMPPAADYLDNIRLVDLSRDGRYLAIVRYGFKSGADDSSGDYKSFSKYYIADLKSGAVEDISKSFPKECSSNVGKFSVGSDFFVFGLGSASYKVDPERKKPPVFSGCDVALLGYYSYKLSAARLQKLGAAKMPANTYVGDFQFNVDNSKVLHLGASIKQTFVSDLNTAKSLLVDQSDFSDQAIPGDGIRHYGFIDDRTLIGAIKTTDVEDPSLAKGRAAYSLVATDISNKKYKVLHTITVDASSKTDPFSSFTQSPSKRFVSFASIENTGLTGIDNQGMFLLDAISGKVSKTMDGKSYFKVIFTPDEKGMILSDAEEVFFISADGSKRYKYAIDNRNLRASARSRRVDDLNIVGDRLFYRTGTKYGECGLTAGKTLYSIPLENGEPRRMSKKLKASCGVFIVNVSDDKSKIFYASSLDPDKAFGIYEVDITDDEYASRQLF